MMGYQYFHFPFLRNFLGANTFRNFSMHNTIAIIHDGPGENIYDWSQPLPR